MMWPSRATRRLFAPILSSREQAQMGHVSSDRARLAFACAALVAVLAGGVQWRHVERVRKAEAAREQVLTALRITSQALVRMNTRLAAHHRATPQD